MKTSTALLQKLHRLRVCCQDVPGSIQFKIVDRLYRVMVLDPDACEDIFDEDHALEYLFQLDLLR
jgi:hypothetical protein